MINPISVEHVELLKDHVIGYENGIITLLRPYDPQKDEDCEYALDSVLIPGLIDLHTHLSQFWVRAAYEPALLPWLQQHVFPAEALSQKPEYARTIAAAFFQNLAANGTTTSVIYTAPFKAACEIAFEEAAKQQARALIGMTMMDMNSPEYLKQSTSEAFEQSVELYEAFSGKDSRLDYIFSPRFALSCTAELLKLTADYAQKHQAFIQSHLSENKDEISQVKELFAAKSYTQVYHDLGILGPKTIMGHAIHLTQDEMSLLAQSNTAIAHCPESNFFLKSGEFRYESMQEMGLRIGLASDVAAGNSLNMFRQAKLANYRQSHFSLSPQRLFWHLTMGSATALGFQDKVGSLEIGKEADLCMIRLNEDHGFDNELLAKLIYVNEDFSIIRTITKGNTVFQK